MSSSRALFTFCSFLLCSLAQAATNGHSSEPISFKTFITKPKLVVVVVIDQFRADYLTRFESRFLPVNGKSAPGGFRYLMEKGAYFPFAEYEVLQNMTCPGHAMILTGARPYSTHIPLNEFMDESKKRILPCTQDDAAPLVGADSNDPDESASPVRLKTSTVGDELKNAGFGSKVVTIAIKARAAVMLGGHRADLALWFHQPQLSWITSRYYLPDGKLPAWVVALNAKLGARADQGNYVWKSTAKETGFSLGTPEANFSRDVDYHSKNAFNTPLGLDVTTEAALEAVKQMKLGQGKSPDLLALSYSAHDGMGHTWGPNSREMEEMAVAEDENLNRLFQGLAKAVPGGLGNVLVVLTADHGMAPTVSYSQKARLGGFEIDDRELVKAGNEALVKKFGAAPKGEWIVGINSLNFYLNHAAIAEKKLSSAVVEEELRQFLEKVNGVEQVVTLSEFRTHILATGLHRKQILNSYIPGISGDVIAIPAPYSYAGDHPTHMTDYAYDRTVPLILAGARMKPGVYSAQARVVDLAPTLSFVLGVIAPATSEGRVLTEALKN